MAISRKKTPNVNTLIDRRRMCHVTLQHYRLLLTLSRDDSAAASHATLICRWHGGCSSSNGRRNRMRRYCVMRWFLLRRPPFITLQRNHVSTLLPVTFACRLRL